LLILTRRIGETLMIGDEVTVTVLGIKGNQVRIGINAPDNIAVHREEIYMRIQQEKKGEPSALAPSSRADSQSKTSSPTIVMKKKRLTPAID